jgi:hypothetical protein
VFGQSRFWWERKERACNQESRLETREKKVKFGEERRYLLISYLAETPRENVQQQHDQGKSCASVCFYKVLFLFQLV